MTDEVEGFRAFLDSLPDRATLEAQVDNAMTWANSAKRPYALLDIWQTGAFTFENSDLLAKTVYEHWNSFDRIPHEEFEEVFNDEWLGDDGFLPHLSVEDRAFYDALPAKGIALYRGQDADGEIGLSWTTDRKVADEFARGHRGIEHPNPVVLKTIVPKDTIAFVCTDRNESEVVLWRVPRWPVRRLKARLVK